MVELLVSLSEWITFSETLVGKLSSKRMFAHELVRPKRGPRLEKRKRLSKNVTRCGCEATCHVHVDVQTSRWYVSVWHFDHNHYFLETIHSLLLPLNRKIGESDMMQICNFTKVGIQPP